MDEFSDDDLDDLNPDELANLENNAIQATQAAKGHAPAPYPPQTTQLDLNYIDLADDDYYVAEDEGYGAAYADPQGVESQQFVQPPPPVKGAATAASAGLRRVVRTQGQQHSGFPPYRPPVLQSVAARGGVGRETPGAPAPAPAGNSSYQTTYNASAYNRGYVQPQKQQYQQPIGTQFTRPPLPGTQAPIRPPPRPNFAPEPSQGFPSSTQNNMVEALKNRIRALEADLNSARGEISIVRSKHNKLIQDHDQELQRVKKHHADLLAQQEEIAKMAQRAEKSAATELEFARRDLRENFSRAQRKDTTPKKASRSFSIGDGFDDFELAPSPSKSQGRFKNAGSVALPIALAERTPSKAKRKRPPVDSPLKPLEIEDGDVIMGDNSQPRYQSQTGSQAIPLPQGPFSHEYTKLLLDHHTTRDRLGTFEVMSKYALPSDPDMPFTNIYLHKIPSMGEPGDPTSLLADFATFTLELWNDCLAQQYYEPILDLLELVTFTLHLDLRVVPRILLLFLPVAQSTCLTIAGPRLHAANSTDLNDEYHTRLARCIDVSRIVSVMHFVALACASAPLDPDTKTNAALQQFWLSVDHKLIFIGLTPQQPIQDYLAFLQLLQTSALPDSIGPASTETDVDQPAARAKVADLLIDRLTNHLRTRQSWGKNTDERYCFTLTVLQTLIAFAASPFGLSRFSTSPRTIARLVCLLCAYVDELYQSDVPLQLAFDNVSIQGPGDEGGCEVNAATKPTIYDIISSAMLLLHTVVTNPNADVLSQLKMRLETIPGSWERYLVTLARLEFAEEDLILERGIDAKTLDLAHELLDLIVTPNPELGEQIVALFGDENDFRPVV